MTSMFIVHVKPRFKKPSIIRYATVYFFVLWGTLPSLTRFNLLNWHLYWEIVPIENIQILKDVKEFIKCICVSHIPPGNHDINAKHGLMRLWLTTAPMLGFFYSKEPFYWHGIIQIPNCTSLIKCLWSLFIINPGNGLSPARHKAVTLTNATHCHLE